MLSLPTLAENSNVGLAAILIGFSIFLVMYAIFAPKANSRTFHSLENNGDIPENGFERYFRPMLRNFLPQSPLSAAGGKNLDKTRELLTKSGNPWNLRAEELFGVQTLAAGLGFFVGLILFVFAFIPFVPPILWILVGPIAGWLIPYSYHNSLRQARGDQVMRQLPEALDLLVITMGSGRTFEPALTEVAPILPDGILREEFLRLDAEMNAGRLLKEALLDFAGRSSSEEAENFAKAIVQSEKLGSPVSETLESQAQASREAYEARVEKKIARLASIMMIPLVFTMIPALILIVLAPTMLNLMSGLS